MKLRKMREEWLPALSLSICQPSDQQTAVNKRKDSLISFAPAKSVFQGRAAKRLQWRATFPHRADRDGISVTFLSEMSMLHGRESRSCDRTTAKASFVGNDAERT